MHENGLAPLRELTALPRPPSSILGGRFAAGKRRRRGRDGKEGREKEGGEGRG